MSHQPATTFSAMEGAFASFVDVAELHHYPGESRLSVGPSARPLHALTLNDTAAHILQQCDGRTAVRAIADRHQETYGIPRPRAESSVAALLNEGLSVGYLRLSPRPLENAIRLSGSKSYHSPQHMALELTSRCNLKCRHCYGDFGAQGDPEIPLSRLQEILGGLIQSGVSVLTLTGGEPFLYSDAVPLLEWVLPRFVLVGAITNATVVADAAIELLGQHRDKTLVQVTINGPREFHDSFVGRSGSFDRVVACARKLVSRGIRVRIAMNINRGNVRQIQYVAGLAHDLGVALLGVEVSHNLGRERLRRQEDEFFRGKDPSDNLEMLGLVTEELAEARQRYPRLFRTLPRNEQLAISAMLDAAGGKPGDAPTFHCGAGRTSVYVAANGDILPCPLAKSCGFPALGNLLTGTLEQAMTSKAARVMAGLSIPVPPLCDSQCRHRSFCAGCIVRGYARYQGGVEPCAWGTRFFGPRDRWLAEAEAEETRAACR